MEPFRPLTRRILSFPCLYPVAVAIEMESYPQGGPSMTTVNMLKVCVYLGRLVDWLTGRPDSHRNACRVRGLSRVVIIVFGGKSWAACRLEVADPRSTTVRIT